MELGRAADRQSYATPVVAVELPGIVGEAEKVTGTAWGEAAAGTNFDDLALRRCPGAVGTGLISDHADKLEPVDIFFINSLGAPPVGLRLLA